MERHSEERRCVELDGRKACVSLENDFWDCIEQIASERGTTINGLVALIAGDASKEELAAVLRVFVLTHYRQLFGSAPPDFPDAAFADAGLPEDQRLH